ncbi:MAG: membrane protein of unknown function [Promethearchaeota archaeon]|nr:MAG: membrane protein of unknown function [Candidatus Lokiarchaeota archaeon]
MIQGIFINNVMYDEFYDESALFVKIIMITYIVAFMIYFFSMEILINRKRLRKTYFIITTINCIFIVLMIISPLEIARLILALVNYPFVILILFLNLFYLTKWSRFEFKAISSLLFLGKISRSSVSYPLTTFNIVLYSNE